MDRKTLKMEKEHQQQQQKTFLTDDTKPSDSSFGLKGSSVYGTRRKWNPKNVTLYRCPDCSEVLYNKQAIMRHRVEAHNFVPDFKCELCSVILTDSEEIEKHKANHMKKKGFICGICEEEFTTYTSLIRHTRYKHTNEKQYKCLLCGFATVEHCKLQDHIRTHTGERPFKCSECDASFNTKVSLTRHKTTHSNVREYICTLCFQQFAISNSLRVHLRSVHAVDPTYTSGVHNTTQHGVPPELEVYLKMVEKTPDEIGKLRYYVIKDQYKEDLKKYFNQVSPLLCGDSDIGTSSSSPSGGNNRVAGPRSATRCSKPKADAAATKGSRRRVRGQNAKSVVLKAEEVSDKEDILVCMEVLDDQAALENSTEEAPISLCLGSQKVEESVNNCAPDIRKKRKQTDTVEGSHSEEKQRKAEHIREKSLVVPTVNVPTVEDNNLNAVSAIEKMESSLETVSGSDKTFDKLNASSLISAATKACDVDKRFNSKEANDTSSSGYQQTYTVVTSRESTKSRDNAETVEASPEIHEELQEERVYEYEYADKDDVTPGGNNRNKSPALEESPEGFAGDVAAGHSVKSEINTGNNETAVGEHSLTYTTKSQEFDNTAQQDRYCDKKADVETEDGRQEMATNNTKEGFKTPAVLENSTKGDVVTDENGGQETHLSTESGGVRRSLENLECFISLSDSGLKRMKEGRYGNRPQVLEVMPDGTVLDITDEYLEHLPAE